MKAGRALGLGHFAHPWLGHTVLDTATGRTGVLRAVCPEPRSSTMPLDPTLRPGDGPPVAWLTPPGGGREWTTRPDALTQQKNTP